MEIFGASSWGLGAAARPFVGLRCVAWRSGIVNPTGPGPGPALGGVNSRAPRGRRPVVYLQPAGNSDRPPIRYNAPFTTCVRGLCHGIQPRCLPAGADCPGVVVSHALLAVAIGARSRSTDTIHASDATTQTLHSTPTLYGSRPQAPLRRLCASDRRPQASAAFRATPEACLNPWTSAPRRHLTPLLSRCGRSLWRLARAGQYQRQRASPWWPLATAVLQQLSGRLPRDPWHDLAWQTHGGRPHRACHRVPG